MKLSIFSRLSIGYFIIFILVLAVSVYAILQLRQFNNVTRSILNIDNIIIDCEKKLTDSLLSQMRYEKRYIIVKDDSLYDQFLLAQIDFGQYLEKAMSIADTARHKDSLNRMKDYYERYRSLFNGEVEYIRANRRYPQSWYKKEKERAIDGIMEELKNLRAYSQQNTYNKIRKLEEAGADAHKMILVIALMALFFGIIISFFITRSITKPLSKMIDKTREISMGILKGDLNLSSPPEIGELAKSFNIMCDKLKMIDKMKSDFFSSMPHELRTPLASIKEGTNQLLEGIGGEVTEKQKRLLTIIAEESTRLIDSVNSLLDLSKMEAGMMPFNFITGDIAPLIKRAVIEIEPLALSKGISIKTEIAQDLPTFKIDSERILQVLRNLIGNAIKFTPDRGQVNISAGFINGSIKVSVSDTGPGIPEENLSTIFEKFQQAPLSGPYQIKGTGLGLAIVKHIVTSQGGRVWAESKFGRGSSFIFVLPV